MFSMHTVMLIIVLAVAVSCQMHSDLRKLYSNLTNNYHNGFFPLSNISDEFRLSFLMVPLVINSIKESEETISLTMATSFTWVDPHLRWDPILNGNITNITVSTGNVWLPYIYLENSMDHLQPIGHDSVFYVFVKYTGLVIWTPGGIMTAKCPMNILIFPFDSQTCRFIFIIWGAVGIRMTFVPLSPHGQMNYYMNNSNWVITETKQYSSSSEAVEEFIFELTVRREPWYNIIVIILPTLLFCLMNPLVFLLPVESGERVSLGMTILLSYAIFLT